MRTDASATTRSILTFSRTPKSFLPPDHEAPRGQGHRMRRMDMQKVIHPDVHNVHT